MATDILASGAEDPIEQEMADESVTARVSTSLRNIFRTRETRVALMKKHHWNDPDHLSNSKAGAVLLKVRAKAKKIKKKHRARFFVHPDSSRKVAFDSLIGLFVVYSVLVVPVRIAFNSPSPTGSPVWILEAVMDSFFFIDIVLSFFTGCRSEDHLVVDSKRIASRYLYTWFVPELLSTITIPIEVIFFSDGGGGSHVEFLKVPCSTHTHTTAELT